MIPQAVLIISLCLVTGRIRHLDRYLCAFAIAIILTSAISILMPTHASSPISIQICGLHPPGRLPRQMWRPTMLYDQEHFVI